MSRVKVSEASGPALDWMVAKIELPNARPFFASGYLQLSNWIPGKAWTPSTDWSQGGPIIEREGIWVSDPTGDVRHPRQWGALLKGTMHDTRGPTPLIAAMRCLVAIKLGDEVDVPEELL